MLSTISANSNKVGGAIFFSLLVYAPLILGVDSGLLRKRNTNRIGNVEGLTLHYVKGRKHGLIQA